MPEIAQGRDYVVVPHAQVLDLPAQALRLARAAFAGYAGVTLPTAGKVNWYLARPRMRRDLSMGAVTPTGMLVASVYITLERVRLAGALEPVALVDTVMTDPEHRQRGLARRTLSAALAASRDAKAVAALLFTVPGSMPYHFYQTLGFRPVQEIAVLARQGSEAVLLGDARVATPADAERLCAFWNHTYGAHNGYVPIDAPLFRWRRVDRPDVLPARTWLCPAEGPLLAAVNLCDAAVIGAPRRTIVLTDLAWAPAAPQAAQTLLASVPPGAEARLLAPESDVALHAVVAGQGFSEIGREAAMLAPLSAAGERLLGELGAPWYALPESVIGV